MRYVRNALLAALLGMFPLSPGFAAKATPVRPALAQGSQGKIAGESEDGTWWANLDQSTRIWFVYGYVAGINYAADQTQVFRSSSNKNVAEEANLLEGMILVAPGATVGQLVEGTDSFYADYRNTGIKVRQALGVVAENISGEDPAVIQAYVRYLRCGATYGADSCKEQASDWIKALGSSMPNSH